MATLNITITSSTINTDLENIERQVAASARRIRTAFSSALSGTPSQNITNMNNALNATSRAAATASGSTSLLEKAIKASETMSVKYSDALNTLAVKYGHMDEQVRRWLPNLNKAEEAIRKQSMSIDGYREKMGLSAGVGEKFNDTISRTAVMQAQLAGRIKYTSDGFESLRSNSGAAEKTVSLYQNAVAKSSQYTSKYGDAVFQLGEKYGQSNAAVARWLPNLNAAETAIRKQADSMDGAGKAGGRFYDSANRVAIMNAELGNKIKYTADGFEAVKEKAAAAVKPLKDVSSGMLGMIPHVAAVTAAYMAMRAALRGVTAAFMEVATFDLEMKRVSAATNATAEEFKRLKDAALEATKATIFTATDSAKALKELALAGFDVNQSIKALPGVLQLATTEEMGLAKATEYATNILNAFGLSVEEIGRVNDVLAVTSAKTSTNLTGLGQAMKYAAPLGSQLGYSIEEVSAMLGVMAQQGIKGGQSGRVLQQAFVRTTKIANELGMDINSGLISVLKELDVRHTSAAKIAEMFGQVALKGILALKSNLDGYHELLDLLAKSEGVMQKMVDRIHAGLIPQLQMLKSVMSVMAIEVASAFEDDLVNSIKEMRVSLDEASPEIQGFAITFIESIRDIINDWTPLASMIVDDIAKIGKAIDEFGSKTVAGTENLMAAGGYGLIGRIVFGSWGPAAIAAGIKMISGEMDAYAKRLKDAKNATDTEKALSGIIEEFFTIDGLLKNLYKGITEVPKIILSITGAQQVQQVLDSQIKEVEQKLLASNQYLAMLDSPIGKSLGISDDQLRAEIDKAKKEIDGLLAKIDQLKNKAASSETTGSPAAAQVDTAMSDLWLSFASGMTAADARIKPIIDNMRTKAAGVMEDYDKRITKSAELGLSNRIKILENERDEVLKSAEILGTTAEEKAKYVSNYSKLIAEEYAKVDARTDKATNATLTYNAAIADLNSKIAAFEGETYASEIAKIEKQYIEYTKTLKGSTAELEKWKAAAEKNIVKKLVEDPLKDLEDNEYDFGATENARAINKIIKDYEKKLVKIEDIEKEIAQIPESHIPKHERVAAYKIKIEANKNAALLFKERAHNDAMAKMQMDYIETIEGPSSPAFKKAYDAQLSAHADMLGAELLAEANFQNEKLGLRMQTMNEVFNREKWMAEKRFDFENANEKKIFDMKLKYLSDMGMEYTKEYRDLAIARIKNEADALEKEFQKAAGGTGQTQAQKDQLTAEQQLTQQLMTEWEERLRAYADYLKGMGDKEGSNTALKAAEDMAKKKIELQNKVKDNAVENLQTMFDKAAWIAQKTQDLDNATFKAKISQVQDGLGSMGSAFTAIQGMYKEGSDEFNRWGEAAKAMMVAQKALAVVNAVAAVAAAATAPFPAGFVAMAAMAAAMASLLGSIGAGGIGGSGTSMSTSYAGTAASQGASGVLGAEIGVGSESIANSIELMQDTYDMENLKLTKIYNELRNLNDNITGLLTSIVRTGGIGMSVEVGTQIGATEQAWNDFTGFITDWTGDFIGGVLNDIVGGFIGSVFGGDTEKWVSAIGITFGEASIQSLLDGIDVVAQKFTVVSTQTSGGVFSDGSFSQEWIYEELDKQVIDAINMIYKSMADTLIYIGEGLGANMQDVYDYVFKEQSTPDLLGMSTEDVNKALNEYFSTMMDTAVYDLFGEILLQYQKIDEGLMETAIRIIYDKEVILSMLEMTGQGFEGTEEEAIALSESLIALAGDLESLADAANTYYEKFTTETEKQADLSNQLYEVMTEMNMVLPDTRDGYAELVAIMAASMNTTTEAGLAAQESYVALLQLAEASDRYYASIEEATQIVNDISEYYYDMMGVTTGLEKEIAAITAEFDKAYDAAVELESSEADLLAIRAAQSDVINKVIADSNAAYWKQVNEWMGTTDELAETIANINAVFDAQYNITKLLHGSEADLLYIREMQRTVIGKIVADEAAAVEKAAADAAKATEEYWKGAVDYYNDIMGITTDLEKQINAVNKAFEGYIKTAEEAGLATEDLAAAQAAAIAKIQADWMYSLVMPFIEIAASLFGWYQGQQGVSGFDQAQTTYDIKLAMIAASGDDAQTQFENTVKALQEFFTTVISGLEQTYEALKNMKITLAQDIEDIRVSGMSTAEQAALYSSRAITGYQELSWLLDEDIPKAAEKVRSDTLKYYELEKQLIADKYNTEISAIKEKNTIELQNIEAVRDKLLSLTYSTYNLALPGAKATSAAGDYASMFAAAQTGDANSVSKYLSFVDTYLSASQEAYKSSQTYQDIYSRVMADIASLDTNPTATIEDLTSEQNRLIEDQTKAMADELAALDQNVIEALGAIDETIGWRLDSVTASIGLVMDLLLNVISSGFPTTETAQSGNVGYSASGMTPSEIQAFYQDSSSILADNFVTTNELLLYGISSQYNQMEALLKLNTTMVDYLYWIGIASYDLNRALNVSGYSEGGIATGPESGYIATLHGTELVVSQKNPVSVRMGSGSGGYNDPEIKELLKTLVVQGGKKQNVVLTIDGKTVTGVMEVVADRLDQARYDKGIKNINYRGSR